ncbi:hypothetical protein [Okeania sp.]|nr:hypothetical protein [Okeania sp.]MEB3339181.1 hypothetical protein [Okeania sp.]
MKIIEEVVRRIIRVIFYPYVAENPKMHDFSGTVPLPPKSWYFISTLKG